MIVRNRQLFPFSLDLKHEQHPFLPTPPPLRPPQQQQQQRAIMPTPSLKKSSPTKKKNTIIFIHPDLGIGGAERLVIDAALGLKSLGHTVVIFTSHCDPTHCFDEARNGMYGQ